MQPSAFYSSVTGSHQLHVLICPILHPYHFLTTTPTTFPPSPSLPLPLRLTSTPSTSEANEYFLKHPWGQPGFVDPGITDAPLSQQGAALAQSCAAAFQARHAYFVNRCPPPSALCLCILMPRCMDLLVTPFHNMALCCPATTPAYVDLHTQLIASRLARRRQTCGRSCLNL
jgi:hypothetical protein